MTGTKKNVQISEENGIDPPCVEFLQQLKNDICRVVECAFATSLL